MTDVLCYQGEEKALSIWPDADLHRDNPPEEGKYDGVYLENFMQQLLRREIGPALRLFYRTLKPGGKIVIAVPSLEWACREIATKDKPSELAYPSIYGDDENLHRCGFTLLWLRNACEAAGFETKEAYGQDILAEFGTDTQRGRVNIYAGVRPVVDAGEAIA